MSRKKPLPKAQAIVSKPGFGRRQILEEDQWAELAGAITAFREDPSDHEAKKTLFLYGVWDAENDCINEAAVNFIYMENT